MQEVERSDPDWAWVEEMVVENSRKYFGFYKVRGITVKRLWRLSPPVNDKAERAQLESQLGHPQLLFHGTTIAGANAIVKEGFRMPDEAGMFGKGIYFAQCPLKSANYAKEPSVWTSISARLNRAFGGESTSGSHKVMLLADVYLGRSKEERNCFNLTAYTEVDSADKLFVGCSDYFCYPHLFCCRCWRPSYSSVYAPGGCCAPLCCNVVSVTEFVIYDPRQAKPVFVIEFATEDEPSDLEAAEAGKQKLRKPAQEQMLEAGNAAA